MSGRFPDAASLSAFWDLLKQGLDVHREIPKDRFDAQAHYDPTGKRKNTSHTPFGCFIEDPGHFDARFFNMSPKEATQTDPMHRLALVTAYEALEMSGYVPNRTPSTMANRIGTFYGQTSDDWREIQDGQEVQTYFIPGRSELETLKFSVAILFLLTLPRRSTSLCSWAYQLPLQVFRTQFQCGHRMLFKSCCDQHRM